MAIGLGLGPVATAAGGSRASAAAVPPGLVAKGGHGMYDCPQGPVEILGGGGAVGIDAATGERDVSRAFSVTINGKVVESVRYPGQGPKRPTTKCTQPFDSDGDQVNDGVFTITVVRVPFA
jgi:hypothetical protein